MDCGKPDPRETLKDGAYTCVNYYKKKIPNAKFTLKGGQLEGPAFGYSEDGEPKYEGRFKRGAEHGEIKTNYDKGSKKFLTITQFKDGKREGVQTEANTYNENSSVTLFKNDEKSGPVYRLTKGEINSVDDCKTPCDAPAIPGYESQWADYKKRQGAAAEQKTADSNKLVERKNRAGVVIERYQLKNSQVFGKHEQFYDNGKPQLVSEQTASRKSSEIEYYDDGQIKRKSTYDKAPGPMRELTREEWFQNGKKKSEIANKFNSDRTVSTVFKEYYDNGKIREEGQKLSPFAIYGGNFGNGRYDGVIKFYSDKGPLQETQTYVKGEREGLSRRITTNEALIPVIVEEIYKDDKLATAVTLDAKTKKKLRESSYMPDGSIKSDKEF